MNNEDFKRLNILTYLRLVLGAERRDEIVLLRVQESRFVRGLRWSLSCPFFLMSWAARNERTRLQLLRRKESLGFLFRAGWLNSGTKYERSERFLICFRRLRRETLPRVTHSRDVCGATPYPVTSSNAVSYLTGRCEVREDAVPVGEDEVAFTIMDSSSSDGPFSRLSGFRRRAAVVQFNESVLDIFVLVA